MIRDAPDDTKILTAAQSKLALLLLIAAFGVPALVISIPAHGVDNRVVRHEAAPPAGFHVGSVGYRCISVPDRPIQKAASCCNQLSASDRPLTTKSRNASDMLRTIATSR
jgi:hypothetical protein